MSTAPITNNTDAIPGVTKHPSGGWQVHFRSRALMYFGPGMLELAKQMRREAEKSTGSDLDVLAGQLRMKYSELKMHFAEDGVLPPASFDGSEDDSADDAEPPAQASPIGQLESPEDRTIVQPPTFAELLNIALEADKPFAEAWADYQTAARRYEQAKAAAIAAWEVFFKELSFWKCDPNVSALSLAKDWVHGVQAQAQNEWRSDEQP